MWLALAVCVGLAGFVAVELRWLAPPWAVLILRIHADGVRLGKGQLSGQLRERLAEILRESGITSGFIAQMRNRRVIFSRNLPASVQQRLRNVLVNRWVD